MQILSRELVEDKNKTSQTLKACGESAKLRGIYYLQHGSKKWSYITQGS